MEETKPANDAVRVAALADLHFSKAPQETLQPMFDEISRTADVMLVCGDLTDFGLPEEARLLGKELTATVKIPIVAVLGNHDFESGKQDEVREILIEAGLRILDGEACEIHGVGFAGVKGFAGGFGRGALGPWGEEMIKRFVHEALNEALKLEAALARLHTPQRVALMHYSPIQETVEGEPEQIFPYLGSSRLEEPLSRYPVTAVFHGHAHHGTPEGRTSGGVPVFNVSMSLLRRAFPDRHPYRILPIPKQLSAEPQS